jgi:hypothetical protein
MIWRLRCEQVHCMPYIARVSLNDNVVVNGFWDRQIKRWCDRKTDRQTDRQGGMMGGWTDRPTGDRQTDIPVKQIIFSTLICKMDNQTNLP